MGFGVVFFVGGVLLCSFEKKKLGGGGGWKICNVNVLQCYYVATIICACLCNEDRLED